MAPMNDHLRHNSVDTIQPSLASLPLDNTAQQGHNTDPHQPHAPKESSDHFWRFAFILFAIFIPLRLFVVEPFLVYGSSMEPNFETGDYLLVDELTYRLEDPQRGDVIVLRPPVADKEKSHFIKRIIGLPGETVIVQNEKVTIKNSAHPDGFILDEPYIRLNSTREATFHLGNDEYFVMGDNRPVSSDSRNWGSLKRTAITGRALVRLYPIGQIELFPGAKDKIPPAVTH